MSDWAFMTPDSQEPWRKVTASAWFRDPWGASYPASWITASSDQEKAAIGLVAVVEATEVPAGFQSTGLVKVVLPDGRPAESHTLVPLSRQVAIDAKVAAIDAERDRRDQLDFAYDFGATPAINDYGVQIEAGVRQLQMRAGDQARWTIAMGLALAGGAEAVLPIRAEDNWNIQTTGAQLIACLAAAAGRNAHHLFNGGRLKTLVRASASWAEADAFDISQGWEPQP
jgi:hypothetical protein